jgi:hypothetical protein
MYLPKLDNIQSSRESATEFRGYNHTYRVSGKEFYDMKNMSGRNYPALSPRVQRGIQKINDLYSIHAHEKFCTVQEVTVGWIGGSEGSGTMRAVFMFYDGKLAGGYNETSLKPKMPLSKAKKTLVNMGSKIFIWPDKIVYDTITDTHENLENTVTTSGDITLQLCKVDATDYQAYTTSDTAPSDPTDGQLWMNTSVTPHVLMQYSVLYLSWQSIPTTYIKMSKTGIGVGFKVYDAVTISGASNSILNGDFILYGVTDDYIVITGTLDKAGTESSAVTIERKVPDMDFLCEHNNRIWGCSSGKHEIYACKLGDPTNWNYFTDQATASYSATIGSTGDFTGCISHGGYVLFFKENEVITLHGNKPSNFQLDYARCRGVEKGSERSLCVVNETLYYKSAYDICAYGATQPTPVSDALGNVHYKNAVAGSIGSLYYISMEDDSGERWLFSYDDKLGIWHKIDKINIEMFATYDKDLYFMTKDDIYSVNGTFLQNFEGQKKLEPPVEWYVETGDIGMGIPNNKYISKLQFRLEVPEGSMVKIELQYDSDGQWTEKYRINATRLRSFTVPIIPRRCDHMKVRISGVGDCKIYSFTRTVEEGSDI